MDAYNWLGKLDYQKFSSTH